MSIPIPNLPTTETSGSHDELNELRDTLKAFEASNNLNSSLTNNIEQSDMKNFSSGTPTTEYSAAVNALRRNQIYNNDYPNTSLSGVEVGGETSLFGISTMRNDTSVGRKTSGVNVFDEGVMDVPLTGSMATVQALKSLQV